MNQRALGVSSFMLWLKFVLICIWLSFSFVSRCSHVWYRSQLFDCILLVFFRQWSTGHARSSKGWCSATISCFSNSSNWCISILAVHSVICSHSDLFTQWFAPSAVRCHTALLLLCFLIVSIHRFWNFYSTIPVDVVRVKSYMNCLFDPARVVIRVTIN